jgi:hypothetical protein
MKNNPVQSELYGVARRAGFGQRRECRAFFSGSRPLPFGHFGNSDIHYNVMPPPDARQGCVSKNAGTLKIHLAIRT